MEERKKKVIMRRKEKKKIYACAIQRTWRRRVVLAQASENELRHGGVMD